MNDLETLLNAAHTSLDGYQSALSVIKYTLKGSLNSDLLKPLGYLFKSFPSNREVRENFRDYTKMTAQTFKETIIQNMNSIEQCIIERARDETSSVIVSDEEIDKQKLEAHYSYMAKIQEVSPEESSSTSQPLEQVQNHDENDVFVNVRRKFWRNLNPLTTIFLEKDDSMLS
ncbi:hypothetical protein Tco_1108665 [Tanacetum coccineum]